MRKDYEKLFTLLESLEPPSGLFNKIMARIWEEECLQSIKKRLVLFSVSLFVSAGAFIPALNASRQGFTNSGFYQYLSLMFSDFGSVMISWQDFGLAVLESLPAISATAFLATLLIFLWSLKRLTKAVKVVLNQPQLINR